MRGSAIICLASLLAALAAGGEVQAQRRGGDAPWYRTGRSGPPGPPPGWRRDGDDVPPRQRCAGPRDGSVIGAIAGGLLGGNQPPIGGGAGAFGRGRGGDC